MLIRPTITDPVGKVLNKADAAIAVIFIGRDHGITPQAESCIEDTLQEAEDIDDPVVNQVREVFTMIQKFGDKVWNDEDRVRQIRACCVAVRDIHYKDWKNEEWMEARPSWVA